MFEETQVRSITKTVLWRIIAVLNSFIISWIFFETILIALGAAVAMNVTGFFIYYLYERVWNRVQWGREPGYEFDEQDLEVLDQLPKTFPDIVCEENDDL